MYLVYLTAGYNPLFSKLIDVCVKTILRVTDTAKVDICVMCDQEYSQYINHLPVKIHITDKSPTAMISSMRKLEVFNIENIMNYERVLFLDGDIVVTKSLIPLFEAATDPTKLYVLEETFENPHTLNFFSLLSYTPEEIKALDDQNIKGFNCGQFLFTPTIEMKTHFANIINHICGYTGIYFYEQSFMNVYFNARYTILDTKLLMEHVKIFPEENVMYEDKRIIHFTGATPNIQWKYNSIVTYLRLAKMID